MERGGFAKIESEGKIMIDKRCLRCDCYDPDYECTMPAYDKYYACPLENEEFEQHVRKNGYVTCGEMEN